MSNDTPSIAQRLREFAIGDSRTTTIAEFDARVRWLEENSPSTWPSMLVVVEKGIDWRSIKLGPKKVICTHDLPQVQRVGPQSSSAGDVLGCIAGWISDEETAA